MAELFLYPARSLMDPILIVEDSKSFASLLASRIKNDLNIDTVVARSLAEATAAVEKAAGRFGLMLAELFISRQEFSMVSPEFRN